MTKGILVLMALVIGGTATAQQRKPATDAEKTAYALGADIGRSFKTQGVQVDVDMLAQGMKDALGSDSLVLSAAECESLVGKFQEELMAKQSERAAAAASVNRAKGKEFLDANKTKDSVQTTASGLQYKVLRLGTGKKPSPTDMVQVNYRGTTLEGKEFDSSYRHGKPTSFRLNQVIRGWTEGLQLMPVGSKFEFFVSADLAYGDRQMGPDIEPGSTLIFEVELLAIQ